MKIFFLKQRKCFLFWIIGLSFIWVRFFISLCLTIFVKNSSKKSFWLRIILWANSIKKRFLFCNILIQCYFFKNIILFFFYSFFLWIFEYRICFLFFFFWIKPTKRFDSHWFLNRWILINIIWLTNKKTITLVRIISINIRRLPKSRRFTYNCAIIFRLWTIQLKVYLLWLNLCH